MTHPALSAGSVAVITGGASGIGLAAAVAFAKLGLRICIVDIGDDRLSGAAAKIAGEAPSGRDAVMTANIDVSDLSAMSKLAADVQQRFGTCDVLMNNAGIQVPTSAIGPRDNWERLIGVNLWGVVNGCQAFAPNMIAGIKPGLIINTGSKQGITTPPGNPAYNVSKAGVKAYTEALSHELRNTDGCQITAHLLIPGFVFTGLTAGDRKEKPAAAWTPEETVTFMMQRIDAGDFYILCPDNDVPRALDERRMLWAIDDIVENRPALSRWHPDYADAFAEFVKTK
ncbi:SDR family NAD(P)-dependent oxidoreductase [Tardiphaga alba]|uniref:SDR family NAD(P)-dependent oxidoreductase n=1 Tax=Tardiphaga alba TaxID=340268 RepID=A0ABX8A528_9BRAD|nr:SDR family NAD(P)-dependent oxidoreductase [Tardiphaga alba]QUS38804.1 SDR family NAD(P)-dependent oxidoreductase [Tardiphaga alba]